MTGRPPTALGRAATRAAVALGAALLAFVPVLVALWALVERKQGGLRRFDGAAALRGLERPRWAYGVAAGVATLVAWGLLRRGRERPALEPLLVAMFVVPALAMWLPQPQIFAVQVLAVSAGLVLALHVTPGRGLARLPGADRSVALALWVLTFAVSVTFALHRHAAYGSGSWDMGCMVHNFFRASRFLDTTSPVLGDVDFLGDHFMLGIYLYAPLTWVWSGASEVIAVQSLNLAAVAPAVFAIARHRGAPLGPAMALGLAAGFAFGMQSAHYFDSHEITVGFGFLAWGVYCLESGRLRAATVLLLVFSLFKESLGAYVVGLGLLALYRGQRDRDRRLLRYGLAWVGLGLVVFLAVNRLAMPYFRARANAPEPHETFQDFGPTVFAAVVGVLGDPLRALLGLFTPDEKQLSILTTLSGVGFVCLLAPEILVAAAPLIAERFLSSKSTMWEMGYHYAAPLAFYAAWAAAVAWPRVDRAVRRPLAVLGAGNSRGRAAFLTSFFVVSAALTNGVGYRHPANFYRWNEDYFAPPARQADHDAAIAFVEAQGRGARVAAQNRLLPHLADRPTIYRLGDHAKVDWVLLSLVDTAWPYDDGFPERLARQLLSSPEHRLVFAAGDTLVFAKGTALPAVPPPSRLAVPGLR